MDIKNIVFDFGNVIRIYDTDAMLDRFSLSENEKSIFNEKIFNSPKWLNCDKGYGYRDVVFSKEVGEMPEKLKSVFYALVARYDFELEFMTENDGIFNLISELKENGYSVYLLSNIGLNFHVLCNKIPVFKLFDGFLPSCDYGVAKPDKRIYEALFGKFSLVPAQCLFIDDNVNNVKSSIECGMDAVCYNASNESIDILRKRLCEKGINIGC